MKPETLIKRYSTLGYEPKGLDLYLEIESINKWLLDTHKIFMCLTFCEYEYKEFGFKRNTWWGKSVWDFSEKFPSTFITDKTFKDPYDAKFDILRQTLRPLKFQRY